MIVMDGLSSLFLLNDLSNFLRNPVIRLEMTSAEEIVELQMQLETLRREHQALKDEYDKLLAKYQNEVFVALRLQDLCREHGVKWR